MEYFLLHRGKLIMSYWGKYSYWNIWDIKMLYMTISSMVFKKIDWQKIQRVLAVSDFGCWDYFSNEHSLIYFYFHGDIQSDLY